MSGPLELFPTTYTAVDSVISRSETPQMYAKGWKNKNFGGKLLVEVLQQNKWIKSTDADIKSILIGPYIYVKLRYKRWDGNVYVDEFVNLSDKDTSRVQRVYKGKIGDWADLKDLTNVDIYVFNVDRGIGSILVDALSNLTWAGNVYEIWTIRLPDHWQVCGDIAPPNDLISKSDYVCDTFFRKNKDTIINTCSADNIVVTHNTPYCQWLATADGEDRINKAKAEYCARPQQTSRTTTKDGVVKILTLPANITSGICRDWKREAIGTNTARLYDEAWYNYCRQGVNFVSTDCKRVGSEPNNTKRLEFDKLWTDHCTNPANTGNPECACFDADPKWANQPECFSLSCKTSDSFRTKAMETTNCASICQNIFSSISQGDSTFAGNLQLINDCQGFGVNLNTGETTTGTNTGTTTGPSSTGGPSSSTGEPSSSTGEPSSSTDEPAEEIPWYLSFWTIGTLSGLFVLFIVLVLTIHPIFLIPAFIALLLGLVTIWMRSNIETFQDSAEDNMPNFMRITKMVGLALIVLWFLYKYYWINNPILVAIGAVIVVYWVWYYLTYIRAPENPLATIGFAIVLLAGILFRFFGYSDNMMKITLALVGVGFIIYVLFRNKSEAFQDENNEISQYYIKLYDKYVSMCPDCQVASCPNILCLRDEPNEYSHFYLVPKYNVLGLYSIQSVHNELYWRVCQRCIEACPYTVCADATLITNPDTNFQLLPTKYNELNEFYIRANNSLYLDVVACPNPCSIDNENILSSISSVPTAMFTIQKIEEVWDEM